MLRMILLMVSIGSAVLSWNPHRDIRSASGQDAKAWIQELAVKQGRIETLTGRFTQRKEASFMGEPLISSGQVRFKRPDRIYLAYDPPRPVVISIDGQRMQIYHVDRGQMEHYALRSAMRSAPFWEPFLQVFQKPFPALERIYHVTYRGLEGERLHHFLLLPKEEKTRRFLAQMELWIDGGSGAIERFLMIESQGDRLRLDFENLRINPPLGDEEFAIRIPPGVKIVEPSGP
jgi:outer membrane lipoprotein-sorting protein